MKITIMKKLALLFLLIAVQIVNAQNANVSNGVIFDGEPYLAINPNDSQHIVIAWMGWINLSDRFQIKTKASFDGGQTWSSAYALPHTQSGYSSADPCVEFNHLGDVFISYIDFTGTTPPVTGGIYLSKSTDGGLSWGAPTEVITTDYDGTKWPIDRPWMAIDRSSSPQQGNIYITSFNLNRTNPPYNPYLSVSTDNGNSFNTRYVDTVGWLAGSLNPLPICFPTVSSSGVLYTSYPSYVVSQSVYTQAFLGVSDDGGNSISHKTIITNNPPAELGNYPLAKKGAPIICNPSDALHLAYVFLSGETGDLDVYLTETYDAGDNWSAPIRVNDDPIMNNRMQDLVWADFDNDGDLVISWRDRRNGLDSTYQANTEIWAAFRAKDSTDFQPNFQLTDQSIPHDTDLEEAGNDFMCVKLQNDTLNAAWGDARDGEINIWFQQMATNGTVLNVQQIASEEIPEVFIYPNPTTSIVNIENKSLQKVIVYDINGKIIMTRLNENGLDKIEISLKHFPIGTYIIEASTSKRVFTRKIIKK
jgi:hypothetical protein